MRSSPCRRPSCAPKATEEPDDERETPDATDGEATVDAAAERPDNHGKLVSDTAQAEIPDGFDNHGAWVRSVARDNGGHSADKAAAKAARTKAPKK